MVKKVVASFSIATCFVFLLVGLLGCSASKSKYRREYARVWKEIIKSEAWNNSLLTTTHQSNPKDMEYYAANTDTGIAEDRFTTYIDMEALFNRRFNSLVTRAYFKIISEAEEADGRLKAEYGRWNKMQQDNGIKKDHDFKKEYETVVRRYQAHKAMLEGLKSWNIFSDSKSDDLDYFKAENRNEVYKMYQNGSTEDSMINYLVYRLADLYHYQD